MYRWFKLVHLFAFSLLTGFMAVVQWSLVPAQNRLTAVGYATLEQGMNQVLETLTPVLMIASVAAGLVVLVMSRRRSSGTRVRYGVALLCAVAMVVSTLVINAPINGAIDAWDAAAPPANWMALRDRWEFGHALRSYVGLVGLLSALAGAIWDAERP